MCKLLITAGVPDHLDAELWKFVKAASAPMVRGDKDGFGYAAVSHERKLFGERWLDIDDRFKYRDSLSPDARKYSSVFGDALELAESYEYFGAEDGPKVGTAAIIAHSRFATCGVSLPNVHPFVYDDIALVHNGIITNATEHVHRVSSCDSEAILTTYVDGGVLADPRLFDTAVAAKLSGSYAAAILTPNTLDIFRNMSSYLAMSRVDKLQSFVFATTDEIIKAGARAIKSSIGPVVNVRANRVLRMDPVTGVVASVTPWSSYGPARAIGYSWKDKLIAEETARLSKEDTPPWTDDTPS